MTFKTRFVAGCVSAGLLMAALPVMAQTIGTTTGQNPTSFSSTQGASGMTGPSPSAYNPTVQALGPDGKPVSGGVQGPNGAMMNLFGAPGTGNRFQQAAAQNNTAPNVRYQMAPPEPNTGTGPLKGVPLPPRTFHNIEE